MRKVIVGVLNIVMPEPHGAQRYVDLLRAAYRTRRPIRVRGEFAAILGSFGRADGGYITGEIYKFFDLQVSGRWLNLQERAPAEAADLDEVVVPDYLKPGLEAFPFFLHPERHRIFFISRERGENFGPQDAVRYFRTLLNQPNLREVFGEIEVTAEPDHDTLRKILTMPDLRRLEIDISPPNPDDFEELEREVKERLNRQNAKRLQMTLVAEAGKSLDPADDIVALANVAKSNGKVSGRGRDEAGHLVDVSTKRHPLLEVSEYDPDTETQSTALHAVASEFFRKLARRNARG